MKTLIKPLYLVLFVAASAFFLNSCDGMLQNSSDRYVFEEDYYLNSANDSVYSVFGILSKLQKIGDRYVILGELRGDLMTVGEKATASMRAVSDFNMVAGTDNDYSSAADYYNIINNCNIAIERMDTAISVRNVKAMYPEFAAIKGIRAWTYLQIALNFGTVKYTEDPVLSSKSAASDYETLDVDGLVDKLIPDLLPYVDTRSLDYQDMDGQYSLYFFFPIRMLLGDMYLLKNQYADAAAMYWGLMDKRNDCLLTNSFSTYWGSTAFLLSDSHFGHFSSYIGEIITKIPYGSAVSDTHSDLVNLTFNSSPSLIPAAQFVTEMDSVKYYHLGQKLGGGTEVTVTRGDLRGRLDIKALNLSVGDAYNRFLLSNDGDMGIFITKFFNSAVVNTGIEDPDNKLLTDRSISEISLNSTISFLNRIALYRQPHLYLRYAEAVNRLGKPTLAFAALKYGLNSDVLSDNKMVNPSELKGEAYLNFSATKYNENVGSAMRGRGLGIPYADLYCIPDFSASATAHADSINWVEDEILREMAAETAFEGNRFFDLMRISRHRDPANPTAYFAKKVSTRFSDPAAAEVKLKDASNWYLK